ncbi:MAG: ArsR family transcriptional regulator [Candidatus Bathyarchaeia archaeon]
MAKSWRSTPLPVLVIETLKRLGSSSDEELLRNLKKDVGDISSSALNQILLKLEIRGVIRASNLTKGRKKIELVS